MTGLSDSNCRKRPDDPSDGIYGRCPLCGHGAEVCQYCRGISERNWEAICDCGLYDFGSHLLSCDIVRDAA